MRYYDAQNTGNLIDGTGVRKGEKIGKGRYEISELWVGFCSLEVYLIYADCENGEDAPGRCWDARTKVSADLESVKMTERKENGVAWLSC